MNKIRNLIVTAALMLAATVSCFATGGNFDAFGGLNTVVVVAPTNILYQAAVFGATNAAIDIRMFTGVAKLDISAGTNVPGTATCGIQVSADNTNWTALLNYAIANPTAQNYTNNYYGGTGTIVTNNYNLAGTNTTPTAAIAGFATPYLIPCPFTNAAATFAIAAPNGVTSIGFSCDDTPRYIRTYVNVGGTGTNVTYSVTLTGKKATGQGLP